jgi:hypothetical protein
MNIIVFGIQMHQNPGKPLWHALNRRLGRINAIRQNEQVVVPPNLRRDFESRRHFCRFLRLAKEVIARLGNKELDIERLQPIKLGLGITPKTPDTENHIPIAPGDQQEFATLLADAHGEEFDIIVGTLTFGNVTCAIGLPSLESHGSGTSGIFHRRVLCLIAFEQRLRAWGLSPLALRLHRLNVLWDG